MKTKLTTLIILASLFLTACKPQYHVEPYIGEYLEKMADTYCNYYCDYPKTLDELISFYQTDTLEYPNSDTINTVLSFLEKEKDDIKWEYCNPRVTTLRLVAVYNKVVLFDKMEELNFPLIDDVIRSFIRYHFEYPSSLYDLLYYDSISRSRSDLDSPLCWEKTREYLWNNRDSIECVVTENGLLTKASHDTIALSGYASRIRCDHMEILMNRVITFTDIHGKFNYSKELREDFQMGLKLLMSDYIRNYQHFNSDFYMVEYHHGKGLSRFCENDDFPLDTEWLKEVEKYVSQFAQEHELERILFYTFAY